MENLNIVEILKLGFVGFAFLLAFLTYKLLSNEQRKTEPKKILIIAIYVFMFFALILAGAGLFADLSKYSPSLNSNKSYDTTILDEIQKLRLAHDTRLDQLNNEYLNVIKEIDPASHIEPYIKEYKDKATRLENLIKSENDDFNTKIQNLQYLLISNSKNNTQ